MKTKKAIRITRNQVLDAYKKYRGEKLSVSLNLRLSGGMQNHFIGPAQNSIFVKYAVITVRGVKRDVIYDKRNGILAWGDDYESTVYCYLMQFVHGSRIQSTTKY